MAKTVATEHGLLMSGPMALAAHRGIKTQTRRPIKPQPGYYACWDGAVQKAIIQDRKDGETYYANSPFGRVGDRVYVREAFSIYHSGASDDYGKIYYAADGAEHDTDGVRVCSIPNRIEVTKRKLTPSIHMPKWAARTSGTIVDIRVERLLDIKPNDIIAEGAVSRPHNDSILGKCPVSAFDGRVYPDLMSLWVAGWDSLYTGELSSEHNPFVWVVEWKKD